MFTLMGRKIAGLLAALTLTACASQSDADSIYINTTISGELMPGVYGQVNIGNVPDYVTVYEEPIVIMPQPAYVMVEPIYLYVPPYHAYHWREYCGYYNACARPVYFVCGRDYRPHYFEPRYYNSRVYEPPRVYRHGHSHVHPRETMYQREMRRDSGYHRLNEGQQYYPQQHPQQHQHQQRSDGRVNWGNDNRRDTPRHDDRRNQPRHDYNRDNGRDKRDQGSNNRQMYINNDRGGDTRTQGSQPRQYQTRDNNIARPNWSQGNQSSGNAVRIQHNNAQQNNFQRNNEQRSFNPQRESRGRTEMPTRQQQYSPQPRVERANFSNGGGNRDDRRRDERRDR